MSQQGVRWPKERVELLRIAVNEKKMRVTDLCKLFQATPQQIRRQLATYGLKIQYQWPEPNMEFFHRYGEDKELKKI